MSSKPNVTVAPADGKLGILIPGMGAVTTTFIAGVEAIKQGMAKPIGSVTQLRHHPPGKTHRQQQPQDQGLRASGRTRRPRIRRLGHLRRELLRSRPARRRARPAMLEKLKEPLEKIKPDDGGLRHEYVKRINGPNLKPKGSKMDHAEMLMDDIRNFKERTGASTPRHDLVRFDRSLPPARRGSPR